MRNLTGGLSGALLFIFAACSSSAQSARQMAPTDVVATIGSTPITLAEVDERALQESVSNFGNARLVQALYLARQMALDEIIGNRLMEEEAKARGIDRATLVEREIASKVQAPTEDDISFWYQTNAARVQGAELARIHDPIKAMLIEERLGAAKIAFINTLKAKTPVNVTLEPPRNKVAAAGYPSKGPSDAPIQIVEFSDFECPFCQRANPTVDQVLKTYGDRIHFVYRHYPLPNHPNARPSAEASACAHEQGRFWQYHDQLFENPSKLTNSDLKAYAPAAGLDVPRFNACFDGRKFKDQVDQDIKEANEAGVSGTPAFFINGRAIEGAQPFEAFKRIIDEELAARKK